MATDETLVPDKRKVKLVQLIILSGWVLTLLLMVGIVGASIVLMMMGHEVPETLKQWGSIALGFLFGGFIGIVKDYVGVDT